MKVKPMMVVRSSRRAFTLIEVMVVVGIIVLLIALLVPAVSAARGSARKAATSTQIRSIALACDSYYQEFRAYPGALPETTYDGGTMVPFSSSQALVMSLTRAFFTATPPTLPQGGITEVGTLPFYVANNPSVLPRDYSENTGGIGYRNYDAMMSPAPGDISNGIGISFSGSLNLPTFVDSAYGTDALPILYYREARKYNPEVVPLPQIVSDAQATIGSYYSQSNTYLGTPGLGGTQTFQTAQASITKLTRPVLEGDIPSQKPGLLTQVIGGQVTPRGAYILISAGADRTYGPDPKGNVDDIIVAGGN